SSGGSGSDDGNVAVRQTISKTKKNPLIQSTKRIKLGISNTQDNSSSGNSSDDEPSRSITVSYKSTRTGKRLGPTDMGATSVQEIDTQEDRDAQAIFSRSLQVQKELKEKEDDKIYRGINNYQQFYEKKDSVVGNAASGKTRKRLSWFCFVPDSCKFLHDRSDYKHGWQLEREMELGTYGQKDEENYEISSDEDDMPFKCFICRNSFKDPVVTKCKHYFCEKCALDHYRKSKRCFVCGEPTGGIYNPAKELTAKLEKMAKQDDLPDDDDDKEGEGS
ncbi:RING finger protein 113a-like, partial [Plakobranchus ocellatus]